MLVVILIGAPGSGKGTSAKEICKHFNLLHVSTGDLLRKEIDKGTQLGQSIDSLLKNGQLVPTETMVKLIESQLLSVQNSAGIVLDGFPRTLQQSEELDKLFAKYNINDYIVIELNVSDDIIKKRIVGRYSCSQCGEIYNQFFKVPSKSGVCDVCGHTEFSRREDDNEATLGKRLSVYSQQTLPVIAFYKQRQKHHMVDASLELASIQNEINKLIQNNINKE